MPSVRFRVSRSAAPISSTPAPAMSEARTRWARGTLARFDRVGVFVGVIGAFRDGSRKPAQANDATVPASAMNDAPAGGEMGEKESGPFRARPSNLSHYAATVVKAQVFVLFCFSA